MQLSRRAVLAGLGSVAALAGCGGGGSKTSSQSAQYLMPFFATGQNEQPILRTGVEQRMPWGVGDAEGLPLKALPDRTLMTLTDASGAAVGQPIEVLRHGDGTPFPYFPLRSTLSKAGTYTVSVTLDGRKLEQPVTFVPPEKVNLVQPGERAIPVITPTPTDHRGVEPYCTRQPACPFHGMTLSDALMNGRPTAFLISTPAFCQTSVCGPVLELLIDEAPSRPINVVHAEVYADAAATGNPLEAHLAEATSAYKLPFEPSLLVMDSNGIVVDRLDFVFDRSELRATLDKVA
jgi:hypothetical protein